MDREETTGFEIPPSERYGLKWGRRDWGHGRPEGGEHHLRIHNYKTSSVLRDTKSNIILDLQTQGGGV